MTHSVTTMKSVPATPTTPPEAEVTMENSLKYLSQAPYPNDDRRLEEEKTHLRNKGFLDLPVHPSSGSTTPDVGLNGQPGLVKQDTQAARAHMIIAERAYKQERLEDAASAIACAVELDWPNPLYRYMAALIISDMRGYQEAFKMIASLHDSKRTPEIWKLGARILQNVGCLVTAELWARNATKFTNNEDDEAMILFQQIRVQRNYSVLAERFPIEVGFTKESFKGIYAKRDISSKEVTLVDIPVLWGQKIDKERYVPACSYCCADLSLPVFHFPDCDSWAPDLHEALKKHWPPFRIVPCNGCKFEEYCSERCRDLSWDTYHKINCPGTNRSAEEVHIYCRAMRTRNREEIPPSNTATPMILTRLWAIVMSKALAMAGDGKKPSVEQITEAMETFRGFIGCDVSGYAQNSRILVNMIQKVFTDKSLPIKFGISDEEFEWRYSQTAINCQEFRPPTHNLKLFKDSLKESQEYDEKRHESLISASDKDPVFSGMFPLHACLNHSCSYNCRVVADFIEDRVGIIVQALRPIKKGDQLTIRYIDVNQPKRKRRQALLRGWGFECTCERCTFEGEDPTKCTHCDRKATPVGATFRACSRCKGAWYCSRDCQKNHWVAGHKNICKEKHGTFSNV